MNRELWVIALASSFIIGFAIYYETIISRTKDPSSRKEYGEQIGGAIRRKKLIS